MASTRLAVTREQVVAHRLAVNGLDERAPPGSFAAAAPAGLQDSMPRAAVLSLHARVADVPTDVWSDRRLVQLWGPRYSVFAVARDDRAVFTLGRLPSDEGRRRRAEGTLARLARVLGDREMDYAEAGRALGVHPNSLRYAAPTGQVLLRWDGAARPVVRLAAPPRMPPDEARRELARRHLQVYGPTTPSAFATWAGITPREAEAVHEQLEHELVPVATPVGDRWVLAADEESLRTRPQAPAPTRLLPSGDAFLLLWDEDRELLVPDDDRRARLWTARVWPGAILLEGTLVGTWRRSAHRVTASPWRPLDARERAAVEAEAVSLPLPGLDREVTVSWEAP